MIIEDKMTRIAQIFTDLKQPLVVSSVLILGKKSVIISAIRGKKNHNNQ